jgi:hypothetical protein
MSKTIILISGKAGVGKTTTANYLRDLLYQDKFISEIFPNASSIKQMCKSVFNWDGVKDGKGRQLLIDLGRVARNYDLDFWVRENSSRIHQSNTEVAIVDDWRYLNEYEFLRRNWPTDSVIKLRVERPESEILKSSSSYNDPSETSLPIGGYSDGYYDAVLDNSGTLDDLCSLVLQTLQEWLIGGII